MRITVAVAVAGALAVMAGCSHPPVDPSVRRHLDQLAAFDANAAPPGEGCGALAASSDSVMLDASASSLPLRLQAAAPVAPTALHLRVVFGSGLPGEQCTDVPAESAPPVIDATWPAAADAGVFSVVAGQQCSSASLWLTNVVVTAPTGQRVALGDVTLRNASWQWWPPFECHLQPEAAAPTT